MKNIEDRHSSLNVSVSPAYLHAESCRDGTDVLEDILKRGWLHLGRVTSGLMNIADPRHPNPALHHCASSQQIRLELCTLRAPPRTLDSRRAGAPSRAALARGASRTPRRCHPACSRGDQMGHAKLGKLLRGHLLTQRKTIHPEWGSPEKRFHVTRFQLKRRA